MPNFKRIGGGPWKSPDDLTWNDPIDVRVCEFAAEKNQLVHNVPSIHILDLLGTDLFQTWSKAMCTNLKI